MINKITISSLSDIEELESVMISAFEPTDDWDEMKAACFITLNKISYPVARSIFEPTEGLEDFMIDVADSHSGDLYFAVKKTYEGILNDEDAFAPSILYYVDSVYMTENYKPANFKEDFTKAIKMLNRGIEPDNYLIVGYENMNFSLFSKKILKDESSENLDNILNKLYHSPELLEKASLKLSSFLKVDYNVIKNENEILYITGEDYELSLEKKEKKTKKMK